MSEKYFDVLIQIDASLAVHPPSFVEYNRLAEILQEEAFRKYFFENLQDNRWLPLLRDKHFFVKPPNPVEEKQSIFFPTWPESRYLLRAVEKVPDAVLDIALNLPETDNARVHEDFAEAACKMAPKLAAQWANKECEWVERQDQLYLNLSHYLGNLVQHLTQGGETTTALKLAATLLDLQPDPQYEEKTKNESKERDSEYFLPYYPKPQPKCDTWEFERILKKNLPSLVKAGGIPVFEWLCVLLAKAMRLSRRHDEISEKRIRDYSNIWRPAIEEHEQNQKHDIKDALIDAVRDAAEMLSEQTTEQVSQVVNTLEDESLSWSIFNRIALHILRVNPNSSTELVRIHLLEKEVFENTDLHHEYWLLARDKFDSLNGEEQQSVIDWRLSDEEEDLNRFRARYIETKSQPPTKEEESAFRHAWLRTELALISGYLPLELKKRYDKAVASVGEADHPDFLTYSTGGWTGPTSPKASQELSTWGFQQLLDYLQSWQPTSEPMSDSRDGLARAISGAVGEQPRKYAEECDDILKIVPPLHPKYIRGFIEGFHEAARTKTVFPWAPVLRLCSWVVEQDREFSPEILAQEIGDGREETNWGWTRKRIANLIEAGLPKTEIEIPIRFKNDVWAIIKKLTMDPEPKLGEEVFMNPATNSINTVRGQAMHTAMRYVPWVKRHSVSKKDKTSSDFGDLPEVRDLLRNRLDRRREKTLTVHSVYARWFPWLVAWDEEWARKYKRKIFPGSAAYDDYWKTGWGTYIVFNLPYDNVFKVLKRDYRKALNRLGTLSVELPGASSVDESLAEHLMTYYWRGLIKRRSEGLMNQFFDNANPDLRGHALGFIGDSIANTDASIYPDIMKRFYGLWAWRLGIALKAGDPRPFHSELKAFGKWFGTQKLRPVQWALEQVLMVLKLVGRIDADEAMVSYLANLADEYPKKVLECFRLMVLNEDDGYTMWLWKKHGKRLLSAIIAGADLDTHDQAIDLVHRLGAMGHREYRELLERQGSS